MPLPDHARRPRRDAASGTAPGIDTDDAGGPSARLLNSIPAPGHRPAARFARKDRVSGPMMPLLSSLPRRIPRRQASRLIGEVIPLLEPRNRRLRSTAAGALIGDHRQAQGALERENRQAKKLSSELDDADGRDRRPSQVDDVAMVSEEDRLAALAHRGGELDGRPGALVVEGLVDVVGDERQGTVLGDELGVAGDPQREVELALRPGRHRADGDRLAAADADQPLGRALRLDVEPGPAPAGDLGEGALGGLDHRAAVGLPEAAQRAAGGEKP